MKFKALTLLAILAVLAGCEMPEMSMNGDRLNPAYNPGGGGSDDGDDRPLAEFTDPRVEPETGNPVLEPGEIIEDDDGPGGNPPTISLPDPTPEPTEPDYPPPAQPGGNATEEGYEAPPMPTS